jgi:hypothetical protein
MHETKRRKRKRKKEIEALLVKHSMHSEEDATTTKRLRKTRKTRNTHDQLPPDPGAVDTVTSRDLIDGNNDEAGTPLQFQPSLRDSVHTEGGGNRQCVPSVDMSALASHQAHTHSHTHIHTHTHTHTHIHTRTHTHTHTHKHTNTHTRAHTHTHTHTPAVWLSADATNDLLRDHRRWTQCIGDRPAVHFDRASVRPWRPRPCPLSRVAAVGFVGCPFVQRYSKVKCDSHGVASLAATQKIITRKCTPRTECEQRESACGWVGGWVWVWMWVGEWVGGWVDGWV